MMFRKLGIMTFLVFSMTFFLSFPAFAECVKCCTPLAKFKCALKKTSNLPVKGALSKSVLSSTIPQARLQKEKDKEKSLITGELVKLRVGGTYDAKVSDFNISKIPVPVIDIFETNISVGGGTDIEPIEAAAQIENKLLVTKDWTNKARAKQREAMKVWLRQNIVEVAGYTATMQAKIKELPLILDDMNKQAKSIDSENKGWAVANSSRHTLSRTLSIYHKIVAMRAQLKAAQKISLCEPKNQSFVPTAFMLEDNKSEQPQEFSFIDFFIKPAFAAGGSSLFATSKPMKVPGADASLSIFSDISDVKDIIDEALKAHNILHSIVDIESIIGERLVAIEEHERVKWLLQANNECNVNLLSPYYNDAEQVWEELAALAVETSTEAHNAADAELSDTLSEDEYDEAIDRIDWDVGRAVLLQLYENQDEMGDKKSPFPLWIDQKAQYDRVLSERYDPIVKHYKAYHDKDVPALPVMEEEIRKYYRDYRNEFVAAHNAHISALPYSITAAPTYHCDPPNGKPCYEEPSAPASIDVPELPPLPLPPWKEIVYMKVAEDPVYPVIPEPWADVMNAPSITSFNTYGVLDSMYGSDADFLINNKIDQASLGFDQELVKSGGEIDSTIDFITLGGTPYFYFDSKEMPRMINRISFYLGLVKQEEEYLILRDEAEAALEEIEQQMRDLLKPANINLADDFDLTKEESYNLAVSLIKGVKAEKSKLAKDAISAVAIKEDSPASAKNSVDEINMMINALNLDNIGLLLLSYQNIVNVEKDFIAAKVVSDELKAYDEQSDKDREEQEDDIGCPIY